MRITRRIAQRSIPPSIIPWSLPSFMLLVVALAASFFTHKPRAASNQVILTEFSDFQCPYCKRVASVVEQVRQTYGERVKVEFKQMPLPMHAHAFKAAQASVCAGEQGRFWEYHDLLFAASDLSDEGLNRMASTAGLNETDFSQCISSERSSAQVERDAAEAQRLGVSGTPTFFVNDKVVTGASTFAALKQQIDSATIDHPLVRSSRREDGVFVDDATSSPGIRPQFPATKNAATRVSSAMKDQPVASITTTSGITLSPATIDFGYQLVGTSSQMGETVTNSSTSPLIITDISVLGRDRSDFHPTYSFTLPVTLAAGNSIAIDLTFNGTAPWRAGTRDAKLRIQHTHGVEFVALTGIGATCGGPVPACSSGCPDTDGDGLNDAWEIAGGIDFNNDGVVSRSEKVLTNFDTLLPDGTISPHPSAEVGRKDVFVRYDYMQVAGSGAACSTSSDCGGHCSDSWAPCNTSADCGAGTCVSDQYCVGHGSINTTKGCNTDFDLGGRCSITTSQACTTDSDCPSRCSATTSQTCRANADCPSGEVCGNYCSGNINLSCASDLDCIPNGAGTCVTGGTESCIFTGEPCVDKVCTGHSDAPTAAALMLVIKAFDAHGISLHISPQNAVLPHTTVTSYGPPINGCATPLGHVNDPGRAIDFYAVKPAATAGAGPQRPFIHYAVFSHFHTCDSVADCNACPPDPESGARPRFRETGLAEIIGNDMIIAYGGLLDAGHGRTPPSDLAMAGTFMHELGHNLGLDHGGPALTSDHATNFKPNYLSVMNYSFQQKGISTASGSCAPDDNPCKTTPVGPPRVDYSNVTLATLDETHLDETIGINSGTNDITTFFCAGFSPGQGAQAGAGNGFINWDCDADKGSESLSGLGLCGTYGLDCGGVDINNDGRTVDVLSGANDWANLNFEFQCDANGHFGDGAAAAGITSRELDIDTAMSRHVLYPTRVVDASALTWQPDKTSQDAQLETLSVVLLGAADFDVRDIELSSLSLSGARPFDVSVQDVNNDGISDLVLQLHKSDIHLPGNTTRVLLNGWLNDSRTFVAESELVDECSR